MAKNNYWISPSQEGWKAKREGASKAAGIFERQEEAEACARDILKNNDGGELITQNRHGRIRSKDTINSDESCPPRDTEH